jgi:hypothetical protein
MIQDDTLSVGRRGLALRSLTLLGHFLMYSLLRLLPIRRLAFEQLPAIVCAWAIAESFYKFHSFTLECGAFLATWFVFDAIAQLIRTAFASGHEARHGNF